MSVVVFMTSFRTIAVCGSSERGLLSPDTEWTISLIALHSTAKGTLMKTYSCQHRGDCVNNLHSQQPHHFKAHPYNSLNVANELSALPGYSNIVLLAQLLPSAALSTHAGSQ
jgi:hypothetical protein